VDSDEILPKKESMSTMTEQQGQVSLHDIQPKLSYVWRLLLVFAAIAAVALLVGNVRRSARNENDLVPATKVELNAISMELEDGSFSYGEDEPVFIGRLLSSWTALSRDRQLKAAAGIRDGLAARNISTASIYSGEALVIQIARGKVLFVE
jgi:hypothetical protein